MLLMNEQLSSSPSESWCLSTTAVKIITSLLLVCCECHNQSVIDYCSIVWFVYGAFLLFYFFELLFSFVFDSRENYFFLDYVSLDGLMWKWRPRSLSHRCLLLYLFFTQDWVMIMCWCLKQEDQDRGSEFITFPWWISHCPGHDGPTEEGHQDS